MTDEKMIEEMASVIKDTYDIATKYYPDEYEPVAFRVYPDDIARELFYAKCRILPENAVVLTREEFDDLTNQNKGLKEENGQLRLENNDLEAQLAQTRKETVEEILQIIDLIDKKYQNIAKEELHSGMIAQAFAVIATKIKKGIAEKYGTVEVEE